MATTQQHPSLSKRIVGSAKGLACSTLSGVSGIEAELRDPINSVTGGKLLATPQASARHVNNGDVTKARRTGRNTSEGFRGDFTKDVDLDPDFEAFARRIEPIAAAPRKSVRFRTSPERKAVLVCDFTKKQSQSESSKVLYGSSPESVMRGLGWRRRDADQYTSTDPQVPLIENRRNLNSEPTTMYESTPQDQQSMQSTWERSQSAAFERLRQFNHQLTEAAVSPPVMKTNQQDWVPADLHWEEIQNEQMRQRLRVPERRLQYERSDSGARDHPMRTFYCRRLSCHRRLVMQEASLDLNCQTRCCVHTGCGYVSQTIEGWERHCASEHNHLTVIEELNPIPSSPLPGSFGWRNVRHPPKLLH